MMYTENFLKAAELIETGDQRFACCAISTVEFGHYSQRRSFFTDAFEPQAEVDDKFDVGTIAFFSTADESRETEKDWRVLALCFAYAMGGEL
jgi:hypothetical protein